MANYVKFRRGTPEAFKALGNRVEDDALYFIYDKDKSTADLYLGSKLISSGEHDLNALSELKLGDLVDTSIQNPLSSSDVLTYSEQAKKWVNRPIEELLETYIPEIDIETDGLSIENLDGKV